MSCCKGSGQDRYLRHSCKNCECNGKIELVRAMSSVVIGDGWGICICNEEKELMLASHSQRVSLGLGEY